MYARHFALYASCELSVICCVFGVWLKLGAMNNYWLTTSETAKKLGVSRQHVVDLCDRGELSYVKIGTHRRVLDSVVQDLIEPPLTREQEKSLWLHRALLTHLMLDPQSVLKTALTNIHNWKSEQRSDGMVTHYLEQWEQVIDSGVDQVVSVLTGTGGASRELRQNSPFAGVLSGDERRRVLLSFREHWAKEHAVA